MVGNVEVEVQLAPRVENVPEIAVLLHWPEQAIRHAGGPDADVLEVSVRVVDEIEGRALNRQYRERDYATNVLSFPLLEDGQSALPAGPQVALGDIVICAPVVAREAREQRLDSGDHWAHMLVHGTLHLLGYDHENADEAREMEALESRILMTGGIVDPYAQT